ncbi:hypothetical protein [Hymenobacter elongatus]|uniref:hypothetical protein n=1 Tax=Hymenobacter elongatus TaxID=877208 RepID=UPI001436766E|nr:hypothetical protein [Hymenobacter elongatus]
MSDRVHIWLIVGVSLIVLYSSLSMLNIQVSLKYEVSNDPCLSVVSGRDLCADYERMK